MPIYIYHIPGVKVGCSKNPNRGKSQSKNATILAELSDDVPAEKAGEIEWLFADHFGYNRGPKYTASVMDHDDIGPLEIELARWMVKTNRDEISLSSIRKYFPKWRHIKDDNHLAEILEEGEEQDYWRLVPGRKKGSLKIVLNY